MYLSLKLAHLALGKKKSLLLKMQQLKLGTGTAIWWLTEPHCNVHILNHELVLKKCTSFIGYGHRERKELLKMKMGKDFFENFFLPFFISFMGQCYKIFSVISGCVWKIN